jgi:CubicO group peptidase (beta-lactamase class C family)
MKKSRSVCLLSLLSLGLGSTAIAAADPAAIDPSAVGLSAQRLTQMEQSIRAGDFNQVTSVLISRGGKLAFERYFDEAGKEGLRNTRSATKSVTSMLIGIAIDRKLLAGTHVEILDFFPTNCHSRIRTPARRALRLKTF